MHANSADLLRNWNNKGGHSETERVVKVGPCLHMVVNTEREELKIF